VIEGWKPSTTADVARFPTLDAESLRSCGLAPLVGQAARLHKALPGRLLPEGCRSPDSGDPPYHGGFALREGGGGSALACRISLLLTYFRCRPRSSLDEPRRSLRTPRPVVSMPSSRPIPLAPQMPPGRRLTESGSDSSARRDLLSGLGLGRWLLVRGIARRRRGLYRRRPSIRSTSRPRATKISVASPGANMPCSTSPGMPVKRLASSPGSPIGPV
jgi:hypothetical protein